MDFSDRIHAKRRSYKTSSRRRRRRHRAPEEEQGGRSDEEEESDESDEEEGLWRRIARLRREVEEVKAEVGRRKHEEKNGEGDDDETEDDENEKEEPSRVAALSKALAELQALVDDGSSPEERVLSRLERPLPGPISLPKQVGCTLIVGLN